MRSDEPKEFKTLDEQCEIVVNQRHLKLPPNRSREESIRKLKLELIQKNYFDLVNGLDDIINVSDSKNKYYGNYSLDDLLGLYKLNKKLRELLLSEISKFEIRLKTSIAYHFSERYPLWNAYCDTGNYKMVSVNDRNECAHFEMINKSRYHAKYPVNNKLIKNLYLRTNRSNRNLNLFQSMCILDKVQGIKESFSCLMIQSQIPNSLKESYLKDIGYWRQCDWPLPFDY